MGKDRRKTNQRKKEMNENNVGFLKIDNEISVFIFSIYVFILLWIDGQNLSFMFCYLGPTMELVIIWLYKKHKNVEDLLTWPKSSDKYFK